VAAAHAADKPKPAASGKPAAVEAAAPIKAALAAEKPMSLQLTTPALHDEGMAIGFTGEELSSALRDVQHAVAQTLIFAVEDSPVATAGKHAYTRISTLKGLGCIRPCAGHTSLAPLMVLYM
jgi:hypothetical protein